MSPRFPCVIPGVQKLSHSLLASKVAQFSVCRVFGGDSSNNGSWFLLEVNVTLGDGCGI